MGLRQWAKWLLYGPSVAVSSSQIIPFPTPEPEHRTSWVFDSHIVTEAAGSPRGSGKNPQAVSLAWDEDRYGINGQPSWFGMTARERKETLLQVFLANPWASNCIDTIALYIISGGFTIEPRVPKPDKSQRKKIENFILRVNDDWDFNQYTYDQITDDMIFGEAFTEFTLRDKAPYRLYPIDCLTMDSEHDRYGRVLRYTQQLSITSEINYLDPKTIVRWWNPHKRAKVDPFSPLERIQDAILLDKKMVNWMTRFFQKGAKFDYYFKGLSDKDEADRFTTWAKQNFLGEKNAHVPPTLWGNADIGTLGSGGPVDIDFDKGLDRMLTIVLSAFHVPPSIACIAESGNRLTDMSDGQRKILQYIACDPRRHRFFEKFNWRLIYPFFGEDYYVSTRYADFRDDKALADVADTRIRNGSLLIDEVRQEMGREAYPDGSGAIAVIVTTKDVTPIARFKDLEDEQRQTAQAAIATAQANADLAATKAKQAKEPPAPVPAALQNAQQGKAPNSTDDGANDDENTDAEPPQPKATTKSRKGAAPVLGNRKTAKASGKQVGNTQEASVPKDAHTGMMLAFLLDVETAAQLAIPGGEPASDLHITLAYLGDMEEEPEDDLLRPHTSPEKIKAVIAGFTAHEAKPLHGQVGGIGRFAASADSDDKDPIIALVDVPGLTEFRTKLISRILACGYFVAQNHGYTPHITLAYVDSGAPMPVKAVPQLPLDLDTVWLCVGETRMPFRLGSDTPPESGESQESVQQPTTKASVAATLQSFWQASASRAATQVDEGAEPLVAYSFTPAEQEQLTELLATAYANAKVQAYRRAMTTAKRDKALDYQAVYHQALHWATPQVESISATYRDTIARLVEQLRTESGEAVPLDEGLVGGLINVAALAAGVAGGVKTFVEWKAPQIAGDTAGSGDNDGTDEAIVELLDKATDPDSASDLNGVRVRVVPDSSSSDFCADYAGNDYSLEEAVDLPDFPAHPGCIHGKEVYVV